MNAKTQERESEIAEQVTDELDELPVEVLEIILNIAKAQEKRRRFANVGNL